jgi:uncharacterized protein (TIGR03083 family)
VAAYERFAAVVEVLGPDDWDRETDCDEWRVRDLVGHMVGAMRAAASFRELLHQQREVGRRHRRDGGNQTDIMTALQIELTAGLDTAALTVECRALVTRAAAGRRRVPAVLRRFVRFPVELASGRERWSLGYLVDVILTRDAWMHRVDLCRAVGAELDLTPDHDGRIVADVVGEWARRHGRPYRLTLTGPAGGSFAGGSDGLAPPPESLTLDAVEFSRMVSGRVRRSGLLTTEVPF